MLKIRSEQIRVFQPDAEESFVRRVMDYLRRNHPDEIVRLPDCENKIAELPENTLRSMVRDGIARARRQYHITWASALISFVVLMFLAAPNFDEQETAKGILSNEEVTADERVDVLTGQMTETDWTKVEENYDARAWSLSGGAEGENV